MYEKKENEKLTNEIRMELRAHKSISIVSEKKYLKTTYCLGV
jgi:hypothetical protein